MPIEGVKWAKVKGAVPKRVDQVLSAGDVIYVEPMTGQPGTKTFVGESRLMRELLFLAEGDKKAVVYFTQSAGELELDAAPGGNTHWKLTIVSAAFEGKTTVARHRMVYDALGDLMQNPIHALSIRALSSGENDG